MKLTPITNEQDWLDLRRNYVTSTQVASLFGLQMKSVPTAFELWHLKRGLIDDVVEDNNYMHFGRVLEPAIVQIIKDNNPEWIVSPMRAFAADDDYGIGSSYDYVVTIPDKSTGILEIKTTAYRDYKERFIEDDDGEFIEMPAYYEVQCQTELEVLNKYDWICCAVAIIDVRDIKYIFRDRDREMGARIRNKVKAFWDSAEPPAPDLIADSDLLARMQRANSSDKAYDATESAEFDIAALSYLDAMSAAKKADDEKKKARSQMLLAMGDCNTAWCNVARVSNKSSFRITPTKGK